MSKTRDFPQKTEFWNCGFSTLQPQFSGYNVGMKRVFLASLAVFLFGLDTQAQDLPSLVARSINTVRQKHGLTPLKTNPSLQRAAASQAIWMAQVGRMDHLREPARSFDEFLSCEYHPSNRVVKSGYFSFDELFRVDKNPNGANVVPLPAANEKVGEIVARGQGGPGAYDCNTVIRGWMNSPGHREQILKAPYREFGVHVCSPRSGETYWCVVFAYR